MSPTRTTPVVTCPPSALSRPCGVVGRDRTKRCARPASERRGHACAEPACAVDTGQRRLRDERHCRRVWSRHGPYDANRRMGELADGGSRRSIASSETLACLGPSSESLSGWSRAEYTARSGPLPPSDVCSRHALAAGVLRVGRSRRA